MSKPNKVQLTTSSIECITTLRVNAQKTRQLLKRQQVLFVLIYLNPLSPLSHFGLSSVSPVLCPASETIDRLGDLGFMPEGNETGDRLGHIKLYHPWTGQSFNYQWNLVCSCAFSLGVGGRSPACNKATLPGLRSQFTRANCTLAWWGHRR